MDNTYELRYNASAGLTAPAEGRTIRGRAIVFGQPSDILYDAREQDKSKRCFIEYIDREAVTEALLRSSNVIANIDHDDKLMMARTSNGSLRLSLQEDGLYFEFDALNTQRSNDLLEMIKTRLYSACSFRYRVLPQDVVWSRNEQGIAVRHVKRIASLHDVSIVVNPAFPQTSVTARSISEALGDTPAQEPIAEPSVADAASASDVPSQEPQTDAARCYQDCLQTISEALRSLNEDAQP